MSDLFYDAIRLKRNQVHARFVAVDIIFILFLILSYWFLDKAPIQKPYRVTNRKLRFAREQTSFGRTAMHFAYCFNTIMPCLKVFYKNLEKS